LADSCPPSTVKSPSRTRKRRIDSARDTALLVSSTADWSSAFSAASERNEETEDDEGLPLRESHSASASGSSVISAPI